MKTYTDIFESIISPENLFAAWGEFKRGKNKREDVLAFEFDLEKHIFELHRDLKSKKYHHGPYSSFYICDPKIRHIYKATVRDRILHHAIFRILNSIFDSTFISTSFSCRVNYGTHRGVRTLGRMLRRVSHNGTRPCFVLKCDIKKFFDSVNHAVLLDLIARKIKDQPLMTIVTEIVGSYFIERERERERVLLRHEKPVCQ